jgi:hypothetical protein
MLNGLFCCSVCAQAPIKHALNVRTSTIADTLLFKPLSPRSAVLKSLLGAALLPFSVVSFFWPGRLVLSRTHITELRASR